MPAVEGMLEETLGLDEGMDEGIRRDQAGWYKQRESALVSTLSAAWEGTTQRARDNAPRGNWTGRREVYSVQGVCCW